MTALTEVAQTVTYTWHETGTRANTTQSSQLAAGAATLILRNASNTPVYSADLSTNGTFASDTGTAGNRAVVMMLTHVSGTLNFRVQRGN